MATNVPTNAQGTRPVEPPVVEPTPVVTPAGVAVYDRDADGVPDTPTRPAASIHADPVPVETRSSGSILTWIIGAIVLIVLAYFLLQFLF